MEKREPSYTVGGNANWCSRSGKLWRLLKKLKIELPYDPAIVLLGLYPKGTGVLVRRGARTPTFTAALLTTAKLWRQPKYPSTDEWMKKMLYVYIMEYYSAIKKKKILPSAMTWMEGATVYYAKQNKSVREDKSHRISLICRI